MDWQLSNVYEIFPRWRHRYPAGTTHNTEHVFELEVPEPIPIRLNPREHLSHLWLPWQEAAQKCFSWSNRAAIEALPDAIALHRHLHRQEHSMTSIHDFSTISRIVAVAAAGLLAVVGAGNLHAQAPVAPPQSAVTVSASSTVTVQNDRLQAWLRAESENANPAAAASQVNAAIAKALAARQSLPRDQSRDRGLFDPTDFGQAKAESLARHAVAEPGLGRFHGGGNA